MAVPTEDEKKQLVEFRKTVEDVLYHDDHQHDSFLIRWIRARDHNLVKAEKMLRHSLEWRKEHEVDKILLTPSNDWFTSNFPYFIDGFDKTGHPVMELPLGSWDIRKALDTEQCAEGDFFKHTCRWFEDIMRMIKESNKDKGEGEWRNTQWTLIVDWQSYSYQQFMHFRAVQSILTWAANFETHYPEIMFRGYFINCPAIFPAMMALLRLFLVPKTLGKITCYGGQNEWGPVLLNDIDADQFSETYGGNRVRHPDGTFTLRKKELDKEED